MPQPLSTVLFSPCRRSCRLGETDHIQRVPTGPYSAVGPSQLLPDCPQGVNVPPHITCHSLWLRGLPTSPGYARSSICFLTCASQPGTGGQPNAIYHRQQLSDRGQYTERLLWSTENGDTLTTAAFQSFPSTIPLPKMRTDVCRSPSPSE